MDDIKEAREAFRLAREVDEDNRREALDDLDFALLSNQWPEPLRKSREEQGRPVLTFNKLLPIIRQVVNDSRQNKPSIKVSPADDNADPVVARILSGLIRNIEYTSNADVAYDTAVEMAVGTGRGYLRVNIDYAYDDAFDRDIRIEPVPNPFSIYQDPYSTASDSADWNLAFVADALPKEQFEKRYPEAEPVSWEDASAELSEMWVTQNTVTVAEWWTREEVEKNIILLSDGSIVDEAMLKDQEFVNGLRLLGVEPLRSRKTKSHKVRQRIISGKEVLYEYEKDAGGWPGCYIPIIPVYGAEVNREGQRHFRSLIRDAKDAQRMFNYWRSTNTELVALAPRAPWIGPKGAFETDQARWNTANTTNWPYIEYDGPVAPTRMPFMGPDASALQEAMSASDDIKAITGIYDASLGARSNETSGKAIIARQREGDVSTFHFLDNLTRGIRHTGRILIDLIPKIYSEQRMIRILGEDGTPQNVRIAPGAPGPSPEQQGQEQQANPNVIPDGVYDVARGKYDLIVSAGPSYTTRRQETADQMMQLIQSVPAVAPIIGDLLVKNLDWPGAEEIAARLKAMIPPQASGGGDPEKEQMIAALQEAQAKLAEMQAQMDNKQAELQIKAQELQVKQFEAETRRLEVIKPPEGARDIGPDGQPLDGSEEPPDPVDMALLEAITSLKNAIATQTMVAAAPKVGVRQEDGTMRMETVI